MGVLDAIARLFGVSKPDPAAQNRQADAGPASNGTAHRPSVAPSEPVAVDLYTDEEDDDMVIDPNAEDRSPDDPRHAGDPDIATDDQDVLEPKPNTLGPAPKNRQELLNELRNNYTEVLGLVRKVDGHLDEQTTRSARLLELAESSSKNMAIIPELAEQNRRIADALTDLVELTRDARTQNEAATERLTKTAVQQLESAQQQTAALQTMQSAMHRSGEAEEKMAQSISGFNETLSDMSSSTKNLGDTIASMRETDAEREAELARLVANSQRWLVAAVIACGVLAVGALALVLNNVI